jgi:hypothetical protein
MIFSTGDGPTTHSHTGISYCSNPTQSRLLSTIHRYYCLYLYLYLWVSNNIERLVVSSTEPSISIEKLFVSSL